MRTLVYIIWTIIVLLTLSCKKDQVSLPNTSLGCDYCPEQYDLRSEPYPDSFHIVNHPGPPCVTSPEYRHLETYSYTEPLLNPNNPYEMAFIRRDMTELLWTTELCIYNFCDNSVEVIADNILYGLDWSSKDWLIYTGVDYNVWKIKANGDSLTQLTFTSYFNDYPKWAPSGEKFIYWDQSNASFRVCDENGNSLSTLSMSMANWTWRTENELIYSNVGNNSLRSYNFIDSSIQVILNHPGIGPSGDHLTINHNNELYTQIDEGLIRVNLSTGDFEIVDTNYYTYNSGYAQQLTDSKILLQRFITDTTYFQECISYEATYISILDEATGEEKRIKIPE